MSTSVPLSPIRPDFRKMDDLAWAVKATRYSTTYRGARALPQDQGVGHKADVARQLALLSTWSADDMRDYVEYDRFNARIREAVSA